MRSKRNPTWISDWRPEDKEFWESTGKYVARRNLIWSIAAEFLGFSIWLIWSIAATKLPQAGFPYTTDQLFTLVALPGLLGSLSRFLYAFAPAIFGGRNWTMFSAAVLLIPTLGLAYFVTQPDTPFWLMLTVAATAGLGGGNFASSMANISFFFPHRMKGTALAVNAAGGNIGVSVVQFLTPLLWGAGFVSLYLATPVADGLYLQNAGLMWVLPITISAGGRTRRSARCRSPPRPRTSRPRPSTTAPPASARRGRSCAGRGSSAISIIAGKATPMHARMMWNPSVSAIWVRAWASSAASGRLRSTGYVEVAVVAGSAGGVVAPVDLGCIRAVDHLGATHAGHVRPGPVGEACRRARTPVISSHVHPSQAANAERSVHLPAARTHRGDRGSAADHRHDALVLVAERLRRPAGEVREQVLGGPHPALERHGAELRERLPVRARDVGDVADRIDPGEALHRQLGLARRYARRSPAARRPPLRPAGRRCRHPTPRNASGSRCRHPASRSPGRPRSPWCPGGARRPCAAVPSPRSRARARRTAPAAVCPRSTMWTRAAVTARSRYSTVMVQRIMSASAPAVSTPVAPAADHDEVERSPVDAARGRGRRPRTRDEAGPQPLGVVERVQRERVAVCARACRRSSARDPAASTIASPVQVSPSVAVTVHVAGSIDAISAILMLTLRLLVEDLAQRDRDAARPSCEVATWYSRGWNWW